MMVWVGTGALDNREFQFFQTGRRTVSPSSNARWSAFCMVVQSNSGLRHCTMGRPKARARSHCKRT